MQNDEAQMRQIAAIWLAAPRAGPALTVRGKEAGHRRLARDADLRAPLLRS